MRHGECRGASSVIVLGPVVELYQITRNPRYLRFAEHIVQQIARHQDLNFIEANRDVKADLSRMGQGKAYQLIWGFTGVLTLHRAAAERHYLEPMENAWANIRDNYLTLGGGPASGLNFPWNEFFAPRGVWRPDAMVETCSTMAWIQFNRELLQITGKAEYAEELEKTFYNQLLAARFPDGEGWAYFTMPNGPRQRTGTFACCSASGSVALEEIAPVVYGRKRGGIAINCYCPSEAAIDLRPGRVVRVYQTTEYPFAPLVKIRLDLDRPAEFPLFIRKPAWTSEVRVDIHGVRLESLEHNAGYLVVRRIWAKANEVDVKLDFQIKHRLLDRANQRWLAITRGPLVYAAAKDVKVIQPEDRPREIPRLTEAPPGFHDPAIAWTGAEDGGTVTFLPYYEAGGTDNGSKRFTWLQVR